jgi:hypothetical protein
MLAIQVIRAVNLDTSDTSTSTPACYVTIHFDRTEIHRTGMGIYTDPNEPIWSDVVMKPIDELRGKERDHNRPLFLESFRVYVHVMVDKNSSEIIAETRVSLCNLALPIWYKLIKPEGGGSSSVFSPSKEAGSLLLALTLTEDPLGEGRIVGFQSLHDELMNKRIQCSPLFLNFDLSPLSLIGADPLPGPSHGEMILDRYETVEVEAFTGTNSFGDKYRLICRGTLYLTDLRLLYITTAITSSPAGYNFFDIPSVEAGDCRNESELLALRRTSFSIPLTSIQDCRSHSLDTNICAIQVTTRDAMSTEFVIKRNPSSKRRRGVTQGVVHFPSPSLSPLVMSTNNNSSGYYSIPDCEPIHDSQKKLNFRSYRCGLQTDEVAPSIWCARVIDEIVWRIREDTIWIKWARCLRLSIEEVVKAFAVTEFSDDEFPSGLELRETEEEDDEEEEEEDEEEEWGRKEEVNSRDESTPWWKTCVLVPAVIRDYNRLAVEGGKEKSQWRIRTNNIRYEICDTYPQTLVFPSSISDFDLERASQERSKQRLPSLVWIHPVSRVALCRSAQPLVGLSKAPEFDKKICLAIQQTSSTKFSLRIADARPFINAQANAIQGKGYENISFLGGPSVAQLFFLDIQNVS